MPKSRKNWLPKHHSQPACSHYNAIFDSQPQKAIVFCTQPQQPEAFTQPFHCDPQRPSCKTQSESQHMTWKQLAVMQQFQCTKHLNTCKLAKHSVNRERKKSAGSFNSNASAVRDRFDSKVAMSGPVAHASQLFSATEHNVSCKS